MSGNPDKEAKMDIWKLSEMSEVPGVTDQMVKVGQKVLIVRMVTVSYEMDIAAIMEGSDETEMTVKALIEDELRNNPVSVESDFVDEMHVEDDLVIAVEIS